MYNNEVNSLISNNTGEEAVFAVFGFLMLIVIIVLLFTLIFNIIVKWIFFKKCGEEGWKSLIPFYNGYTLIKIAGLNWWWTLILYGSVILSTMQSTINVMEKSDSTSVLAPVVLLVSILSMFASLAALFTRINYSINISKRFNKSVAYTVLLVLFEPIMLLVLGLSKDAKYDETVEVSPNGLFGMKTSKPSVYCPDCGTQVNEDYCPKCGKKVR